MIPRHFDDLPEALRKEPVRPYFEALNRRRFSLSLKRVFDVVVSLVLIVLFSPLMIVIAAAVKLSSEGPVFYRQKRITAFEREFRIFKFRSMVSNADKIGPLVTTGDDPRITAVGHFIRKTHIDEIPQLFNVLAGDMSFVGTRPEVRKYVDFYTDEMRATLLLPAGITSEASIRFRDEAEQIPEGMDADEVYVNSILPQKMEVNLEYLRTFSFIKDIRILFDTFLLFFRR